MNIRFGIIRDRDPYSMLLNSSLEILLTYDGNNEEQAKFADYITPERNERYGLLGSIQAVKKFNEMIVENDLLLFIHRYLERNPDGSSLKRIVFNLPYKNSRRLLVLLSMLEDTIRFANKKKIDISFNITDIFNALGKAYADDDQASCSAALLLKKMMTTLTDNPSIAPRDVILLYFAFSYINFLEMPLQFTDHLPIVNLIEALFKRTEGITSGKISDFLKALNVIQKIKLYEPCLGEIAHDKALYNWNYTEWSFIHDGQVSLNPHGNMCIRIRMGRGSKAYAEHYAPRKRLHHVFHDELNTLAPHIGLSFEPSNYHEEIIFTKACSEKLFGLELHLSIEQDLKKLLKARNNHLLFEQAAKSGDFTDKLCRDIIKLIFTFTLGPLIATAELDLPKQVACVLHG